MIFGVNEIGDGKTKSTSDKEWKLRSGFCLKLLLNFLFSRRSSNLTVAAKLRCTVEYEDRILLLLS